MYEYFIFIFLCTLLFLRKIHHFLCVVLGVCRKNPLVVLLTHCSARKNVRLCRITQEMFIGKGMAVNSILLNSPKFTWLENCISFGATFSVSPIYSHFKKRWKTFSAPNASYSKKYLSQFFIKMTIPLSAVCDLSTTQETNIPRKLKLLRSFRSLLILLQYPLVLYKFK